MNSYQSIVACLVVGVVISGCSVDDNEGDRTSSGGISGISTPTMTAETKRDYLDAINNARAVDQDCGSAGLKSAVPALAWSDALYAVALEHSRDMALSNTFEHKGSGEESDITAQEENLGHGSSMRERIEHNGYQWSKLGENIAAGTNTDTAPEVINQWLASDGHCANLMSPDFTEVGMAMVEESNSEYTHYWTQNFAKPQ